jgi:hypothetical protein
VVLSLPLQLVFHDRTYSDEVDVGSTDAKLLASDAECELVAFVRVLRSLCRNKRKVRKHVE